jgi:hypothetical protein
MTSRIVFPDNPEKRRASRVFRTALELINGVSLGSLDEIQGGAVKSFFSSIRNTLDFDFEESGEGKLESTEEPSLFIFVNCSTRELSEVEKKHSQHQLQLCFSTWSLRHCGLTWDFSDFLQRRFIIDFFLNFYPFTTFELETIQRQ